MGTTIIKVVIFGIFLHLSSQQMPEFLVEPSNVATELKSMAQFVCKLSPSLRNVEISWYKNGLRIQETSHPRFRFSSDKSILQIRSVQQEDSGIYQCAAKYSDDKPGNHMKRVRSRKATLRIDWSRQKPKITNRPLHTEVKRGEVIRLTCGATGFPRPSFSWYKNGGRLSNVHDRFEIHDDGTLVITNAQLDDSAHYRCSATNYLGRASSTARVKVNLAIPETAPYFTSKPRDSRIREGSIVEFTCVARGQPYPDLTWWNNNRIVNSNGRVTVSNGGQHLRLVNVKVYDSGKYVCRASNSLGEVEVGANLEVVPEDRNILFLQEPHDMLVPVDTTIQMPCKVTGNPIPSIKWLKDSEMIEAGDKHFRVTDEGNLIIFNVKSDDEGFYECLAQNGRESRKSGAQLRVRLLPVQVRDETPFSLPSRSQSNGRGASSTQVPPTVQYTPNVPSTPGDEFVLIALEEASRSVDKAINATVDNFFHNTRKVNQSSAELFRLFRYPPANEIEVAKAAEIFERTLEIVAQKVKQGHDPDMMAEHGNFSYKDLVSPSNLELIANLSGCEAHRVSREVNCQEDLCFHAKFRSIDGTCNNFQYPMNGASLTAFKRLLPSEYENGFNTPIGWDKHRTYYGFPKPGARHVSNVLISSSKVTQDNDLSHMAMQWGQFLDHDIDHSMEAISRETFENGITCGSTCQNQHPCFPIEIPLDDPRIAAERCMEFTRSSAACGSGSTSVFFNEIQPREQLNQLTSYIDASQVYGSQDDFAISLRNLTNDYGRLREGLSLGYAKPLLPFNEGHPIDCRRDPTESNIGCFLAGDVRANEQVALLSMHTIWFRHHNTIASKLRSLNPHWSGDRLYHESRKILGAQMQHITYKHWLPAIIGPEGMKMLGDYQGYNPAIDASISNIFASSTFRFGHTMVNPVLKRLDPNFQSISEGDLPLHKAFFAPWRLVQEGGIDPILRGLFATPAKKHKPDQVMNDELTENLFDVAHAVALDLGALNVQRGRDHGLPSYASWRKFCGLGDTHSWDDLVEDISDLNVRQKLAGVYGNPNNVDVWVGGLLEQVVSGGRVGRTVRCIMVEQFKRLRDGDRFWYENPSTFKQPQLDQLKATSLAGIICDNADDITKITNNVFKRPNKKNDYLDCSQIIRPSWNPWHECKDEDGLLSSIGRSR